MLADAASLQDRGMIARVASIESNQRVPYCLACRGPVDAGGTTELS